MSSTDSTDRGKNDIIDGILADAEAEVRTIIDEGERARADRMAASDVQCSTIAEEAERAVAKQCAAIMANASVLVSVTRRRQGLKLRERVMAEIIGRTEARMAALVDEPSYREILAGWIVEAAMGLGFQDSEVNASRAERDALLAAIPEALKSIRDLTDREVSLAAAPSEAPLVAQGVVVTAHNRTTAFNNQVQARLARYQTEIRSMVYNQLFHED